jgi:hypothetical protein
MEVAIILVVVGVLLFIGAFISKRRFGLLGLALTAGATLSSLWTYDAGLVVSSTGLVSDGPITNAVALSIVVLLPAVLLLFHGYTYKSPVSRVLGSLFFATLAMAFLLEPLRFALPLTGPAADLYGALLTHKDIIISVGVVIAIIDLFFTKPASDKKDKRR